MSTWDGLGQGSVSWPPVLLCVDDRPQFLQLRKNKLTLTLGYSVKTACDTASALAVLNETWVAVVLLEYKSEGMDAEAVALRIRQRFPDEPLILLSAYAEMPVRIFWLVDGYVMRSEPVDKLAQVIARVASQRHNAPSAQQRLRRTAAG